MAKPVSLSPSFSAASAWPRISFVSTSNSLSCWAASMRFAFRSAMICSRRSRSDAKNAGFSSSLTRISWRMIPNQLTNQLRRAATALRQTGVDIEPTHRGRGKEKKRWLKIGVTPTEGTGSVTHDTTEDEER
jgi:hypothetical protein